MKIKCFYKLKNNPGLYVYTEARTGKETYLVSWWRLDDTTNKRIDMDIQQEMVIRQDQEDDWVLMDDSIEKRVMSHWRQG